MLRNATANTPVGNSRRLLSIVWFFVAIVVGLLVFAYFSFGLMSAARAYVGAEGLWSKSQKDAVLALSRYVHESNPQDYKAFQDALQVTLGDRKARLELEKPNPDLQVAAQGFVQGRNHPDDVDGMVHLYRRFRSLPELDRAIAIWAEADTQIDQLVQLGNAVQRATVTGRLDEASRLAFLAQLAHTNQQLTPLEDDFSYLLGEISRKSSRVIRSIMVLVVTVLLAIAYFVSRRIVQQNENFHQSLVDSEDQLRILLQFAPLPIIITGLPENAVTYANARALAQVKLSEAQMRELAVEDLYVDPTQRGLVMEELRNHGSVRDREIQLQDKEGHTFWVLMSSQRLRVNDRECILTAFNNIDDRKQAQEKLQHRAFHDELTGLPNRAMFMDTLSRTLHRAERKQGGFSVLFIDLDHFKQVNDVYGHLMGDQVIQFVAEKLKENIRTSDLLVRYGGDEFIVLIENVGMERALKIAEKIRSEIYEAKSVDNVRCPDLKVSISIGVAIGATSWMALLEKADRALFQAKEQGKNKVVAYSVDEVNESYYI